MKAAAVLQMGENQQIYCVCESFTSDQIELIPAIDVVESKKKDNAVSMYEHFIQTCTLHGIPEETVRKFLEYQTLSEFPQTVPVKLAGAVLFYPFFGSKREILHTPLTVIFGSTRPANCITIYPNTDQLEVCTMEYGYIRVSTREQNEQRQLIAMREFGISPNKIYMDKQSGKDFERKNYKKMVRKLKKDDTLVVKSIDRLGRNYEEILEQWQDQKISARSAAKQLGITHSTFLRRVKECNG